MTDTRSSSATEIALRLLQASSCFRPGAACGSLPCACAQSLVDALSPQAQAGETRPFYGAECPSYPACEGGCGLGCTKEIERSRHSAQPPIVLEALRLAWTCLNDLTDDDPSQYAISKGKIAAAISSVSSTEGKSDV